MTTTVRGKLADLVERKEALEENIRLLHKDINHDEDRLRQVGGEIRTILNSTPLSFDDVITLNAKSYAVTHLKDLRVIDVRDKPEILDVPYNDTPRKSISKADPS